MDPFLQYTPSIRAAGAYCLATYTINNSLWVSLTTEIVSCDFFLFTLQKCTYFLLHFSLIPWFPLLDTPWMKSCPAWLISTNYTWVQRAGLSRPSGTSTEAQSKLWHPWFLVVKREGLGCTLDSDSDMFKQTCLCFSFTGTAVFQGSPRLLFCLNSDLLIHLSDPPVSPWSQKTKSKSSTAVNHNTTFLSHM